MELKILMLILTRGNCKEVCRFRETEGLFQEYLTT